MFKRAHFKLRNTSRLFIYSASSRLIECIDLQLPESVRENPTTITIGEKSLSSTNEFGECDDSLSSSYISSIQ